MTLGFMSNSTLKKVKQERQEKCLPNISSERNRWIFPGVPERMEIPQLADLPLLNIRDQHRSSGVLPAVHCAPEATKFENKQKLTKKAIEIKLSTLKFIKSRHTGS